MKLNEDCIQQRRQWKSNSIRFAAFVFQPLRSHVMCVKCPWPQDYGHFEEFLGAAFKKQKVLQTYNSYFHEKQTYFPAYTANNNINPCELLYIGIYKSKATYQANFLAYNAVPQPSPFIWNKMAERRAPYIIATSSWHHISTSALVSHNYWTVYWDW